jgi:DNA-binding LacI/PurR family transcriptional regulator
MPGSAASHPALNDLVRQRFPIVIIDEEVSDVQTASIFVDNRSGGLEVGRHLEISGIDVSRLLVGLPFEHRDGTHPWRT